MVPKQSADPADADASYLTIEDLEGRELPDCWELAEGRFIELLPSGAWAARIAVRDFLLFLEHGEHRGLGVAYPTPTGFVLFPDRQTLRAPDAAFVLAGRAVPPDFPDFVPGPPDLAVEVLSPHDRIPDTLAKVSMYLRAGTRLTWLVFPDGHQVTVFTPNAPLVTLGIDGILDGGDVLPDLRTPTRS